jgi:hypothetical protein
VEPEYRAAGHTDAVARHQVQNQGAGRQAWPVDHHALARLAHPIEQFEEWADFAAGAGENSDFGMCG